MVNIELHRRTFLIKQEYIRKIKRKREKMKFGKKLYSVYESYWILYKGLRTAKYMSNARKTDGLSTEFSERIMLAVTEVNGCAACSYAHTKIALEAGMSNEEIKKILEGVFDNVPAEEVAAVLFAQHYAETRGNPSKDAWERIVEIYGLTKAEGILGAIRMIMIGNTYGIAWSSFAGRFKGKADKRSSLFYEISMVLATILFIPIVLVHVMISKLFRVSILSFRQSSAYSA